VTRLRLRGKGIVGFTSSPPYARHTRVHASPARAPPPTTSFSLGTPLCVMTTIDPEPLVSEHFGEGNGLAHCATLGVFVVSTFDGTLHVVKTPVVGTRVAMERLYTLGGPSSKPPMTFNFSELDNSGRMAFTGPPHRRRLLVVENVRNLVHVIDVVGKVHEGYLAEAGIIQGPVGIAATESMVAVSAWKYYHQRDHVVFLFGGDGDKWTRIHMLKTGFGAPGSAYGQLHCPHGVRFTADGTEVVVADCYNHRVSAFCVEDGTFVRHVTTQVRYPWDVEEWDGGWMVISWETREIKFVHNGATRQAPLNLDTQRMLGAPGATALVPGLGLLVRTRFCGGRVFAFATYDTIAMAGMSVNRMGWMLAVARCALARGRVTGGRARKSRKVARRAGAVS
jgi:hypothetical protein